MHANAYSRVAMLVVLNKLQKLPEGTLLLDNLHRMRSAQKQALLPADLREQTKTRDMLN